ncbi:MAG TPA: hypothetical protein ENH70_03420 [Desulfobacteraceae bacterium]|nr:hypothetical protein [Desulfobacteraceae bacterium]
MAKSESNEAKTLHLQWYDRAYTNPSTPKIQGSLTIRNGEIIHAYPVDTEWCVGVRSCACQIILGHC